MSGITLETIKDKGKKKVFLILSLLFNVGLLFVFKYLGFFSENIDFLFKNFGIKLSLVSFNNILPIGISYYTFQLISYNVDIYNGKIKAERHPGYFIIYICFFLKVLSGPIERAGKFIPQLQIEKDFNYESVINGSKRFLYGYFKKVVIADGIAYHFKNIYFNPVDYHGLSQIISVLFYSIQIYADFSGYTDMALGSAEILNIKLTDNFRYPYFSKSISDFWKKWHITLTSWLMEYLFLPLSYSFARKFIMMKRIKLKPDMWAYILSIFITMTICGLWHGPKWTYIVWGMLHGFYLLIGFLTRKKRKKLYRTIGLNSKIRNTFSILFTFVLVSFAWIFFKSDDISSAFMVIKNCFEPDFTFYFFKYKTEFIVLVLSIIIMFILEFIQYRYNNKEGKYLEILVLLKWPVIILILTLSILFQSGSKMDFLYFRF
jgi:D-alanyl-lipoteichoic acid acyltransferase DltB (MBOAT superfamily)